MSPASPHASLVDLILIAFLQDKLEWSCGELQITGGAYGQNLHAKRKQPPTTRCDKWLLADKD